MDFPAALIEELGLESDDFAKLGRTGEVACAISLAGLTEREEQVIRSRYFENKTLEEVGEEQGVQRERARQIIARAVRKLRASPAARCVIQYGLRKWIDDEVEARVEKAVHQKTEEIDKLRDALLREAGKTEEEARAIVQEADKRNTPIEDIGLSVRAYNCLMRANLTTVGDVCALADWDSLIRIRNLGHKSADEIVSRLRANGFPCEQFRRGA